ncbi:hypothetical protein [Amycolatopsis sp. NPDC059021]|uniref:hypothetical protein n=1 Tax=Amycolatopsis sp. NPDC059021 TaxID=3346704 RepID=UPI00366C0659
MGNGQRGSGASDDKYHVLDADWGKIRVPKDSLIALALNPENEERERRLLIERGTMNWSISKLGDLLWMFVPEFRPMIAELARREFYEAVQYNRFLTPIRETPLADALYTEIIRPIMTVLPEKQELLERCLLVMHRILAETRDLYHLDVFCIEILDPLFAAGHRAVIEALNPDLVLLVEELNAQQEVERSS